jgi:HAD superfamily hydrolase (TIGR01509 family)
MKNLETEALIFDFDGVLADTIQAHTLAINPAFEQLGLSISSNVLVSAHSHGSNSLQIIGWVLKEAGLIPMTANFHSDPLVQKVLALKTALYHDVASTGLTPVSGALEFIRWAESRFTPSGLAIATTAVVGSEVSPFLKRHGIEECFGCVAGRESVGVDRLKPHPDVYLVPVLKNLLLGLNPVAIEDSPIGVEAAKNAGMTVVGLTTTHQEKYLDEADLTVESFDNLKELVN